MGRNNRRDGRGQGTTRAQGPLDRFTEVDDLLRETNNTLTTLDSTVRSLAEAIDDQTDIEIELPVQNELPLVADAVIAPDVTAGSGLDTDNTEQFDLNIPRSGRVTRVLLAFPQGANQSVGIGVAGADGQQLIPFGPSGTKFVALDGETVEFELDYPVEKGETVTVNFVNTRQAETEQEVEDLTAFANAIVTVTED